MEKKTVANCGHSSCAHKQNGSSSNSNNSNGNSSNNITSTAATSPIQQQLLAKRSANGVVAIGEGEWEGELSRPGGAGLDGARETPRQLEGERKQPTMGNSNI